MAVYKCKSCGAALEVTGNESVVVCDYCDVVNAIPKVQDENLQGLYNRANTLRIKCEFDKAEKLYEKIIETDNTQYEAYWGLILCRYGIEYVEDVKTFKRIPTCHRASFESIIADEDYKSALTYADALQRKVYESDAREIDRIQKEILALSSKEEPYDVFICYKQSDDSGKRTKDSGLANDIYYQLTQEGYKVFYAAITLEDKLGSAYEPIIFAALNSAKVMLAIGTKPEYFNAVWVKNEWSRFMKIMKKDRSKMLVPCYMDMDAYELPDEFANLQALNMSSIGFIPDLVRNIKKIIVKEEAVAAVASHQAASQGSAESAHVAPLLKRASMYLEDGDFVAANEYCEKVLDQEPENSTAYLYKLLADLKLTSVDKLGKVKGNASIDARAGKIMIKSFPKDKELLVLKIVREISGCGLAEAKNYLNNPGAIYTVTKVKAQELNNLGAVIEYTEKASGDNATLASVENNNNYKKFIRFATKSEKADVERYIDEAKAATILSAKKVEFGNASSLMQKAVKSHEFKNAALKFDSLGDFENAVEMANKCRELEENAKKEEVYTYAKKNLTSGDPDYLQRSFEMFGEIEGYKDADALKASIPQLIEEAKATIAANKRNSDYDYAVKTSNSGKSADIRKAIKMFQELGDYKNAKGMVTVLTTKLQNTESRELDAKLREKYKKEYENKYPDASRKEEYESKCKTVSTEIANTRNYRTNANPGCFAWGFLIAGIFTFLLGIMAIVEDEEDLIGALIIGIIILIASLKSIIGSFKNRSGYSLQIKSKERELAIYHDKLSAISKMPSFDAYIDEKRRSLTKAEIELLLPGTGGNIGVVDAVEPKKEDVSFQSIKCKMCGADNQVPADDLNATCKFCGSNLRR